MAQLDYNPILDVDSYKAAHQFSYPKNVTGMTSYIEARTKNDVIIPFGLSMYLQKYMTQRVTMAHIDEAEEFFKVHGEPFSRDPWEHIVNEYHGFFPVVIRAVPEGTPVKSSNAIATITCQDPKVFWLSSYVETKIQRAIWYPTTIASMDYAIKRVFKEFYEATGADMNLLPFALHDFGARGVASYEQSEIGGAAHLVNFMGSDTVAGVRAANFYYKEPMAGFSVPATEHSVQCSFGPDDEIGYLDHIITNLAKPGGIVSIVIDGYDVYRAAQTLCTTLKDKIIASGAKVVFRPDSGDMQVVVPRILELQAATFDYDINEKGFKKVRHVGIIQGDGVDHLSIRSLLGKLKVMGYSADNVVFGTGGALLQKVNRDSYRFCQKASAIMIDGKWVGISKDPITDPGKRSKEGVLTLVKSNLTGEYSTARIDQQRLDSEFEDQMELVYYNGRIMVEPTLAEIRERCKI